MNKDPVDNSNDIPPWLPQFLDKLNKSPLSTNSATVNFWDKQSTLNTALLRRKRKAIYTRSSEDNYLVPPDEFHKYLEIYRYLQQFTKNKKSKRLKYKCSASYHINNKRRSSYRKNYNNTFNSSSTHDSYSLSVSNNGFNYFTENSLPDNIVGGRLSSFASLWSSILQEPLHPWLFKVIRNGFKLYFNYPPPLTLKVNQPYGINQFSTTSISVIDKEINTLLLKNAIEHVNDRSFGFISNLFVIPKKDGGLRPVLNLRRLNEYLPQRHFKMETLQMISSLLQPNDYLTSIDLQDAFHHIPIDITSRNYLRFMWKQQLYQYKVLPFGLALSPWVFTKVVKPLLHWARKQGVRITAYLDDILIMAPTREKSILHTQLVHDKMKQMGWLINDKKSQLTPTQKIDHLGMTINTMDMTLTVPGKKIRSIRRLAYKLLYKTSTTWKLLSSFIGTALATFMGNIQAKFRTRRLIQQLNIYRKKSTDHLVPINQHMKQELTWWISQLLKWNGRNIIQQSPLQIFTDASNDGWGIVSDNGNLNGKWSPSVIHEHINYKELLVVKKAIKWQHQKQLHINNSHLHFQICIDNLSAMSYIYKFGGTRSKKLNNLAMDIWKYCFSNNVELSTLYVPSKLNPADAPSRQLHDQIEWSIPQRTFDWLDNLWGPHVVDLFASPKNSKIPTYFISYQYYSDAAGTNAFSISWNNINGRIYLAPPWNLILQVLQRLQKSPQSATLITPNWPSAPWYPIAVNLAQQQPIILQQHHLIDHEEDNHIIKKNNRWTMLAWDLDQPT